MADESTLAPSKLVVGLIVFMIFMSGMGAMIMIADTQNDKRPGATANFVPQDNRYNDFMKSFNQTAALTANTTALENRLLVDGEISKFDSFIILFGKTINVLLSITPMIRIATGMVESISIIFTFVPGWFTALLSALLLIVVMFAILSAILQRPI